jgi:hypothetical protein
LGEPAVGRVLLALEGKENQSHSVELGITMGLERRIITGLKEQRLHFADGNIIPKPGGEDGELRCHAVLFFRLVFRHSLRTDLSPRPAGCKTGLAAADLKSGTAS